MPNFSKAALSQFLKTDCRRQLKLQLSKDCAAEVEALKMPPRQPQRPGFSYVSEAGNEWEAAKLAELREHLGTEVLRGSGTWRPGKTGPRFEYAKVALHDGNMLPSAAPGEFLVQAWFDIEDERAPDGMTYARASGLQALRERFGLTVSSVIPDLIQVLPPGTFPSRVLPSGEVERLPDGDRRPQLRVVDIKMTSEPGAGYFAEVTYYAMALAGWLEDYNHPADGAPLARHFVVVPEAAIWPGSHEASALVKLVRKSRDDGTVASVAERIAAWESELEQTVFDVFKFRVDHVIREVLPEVLVSDWSSLGFHVTPSCKNCDYLGYPWKKNGEETADPKHCWPSGEGKDGHLSRIPRMSRGAAEVLTLAGHGTIEALARLQPTHAAFDEHQSLRAGRTVIAHRAAALRKDAPEDAFGVAPDSGTSASMPSFVNLKLFVTASFDISSALTLSFGVSGQWYAKIPHVPGSEARKSFGARVMVSDLWDLETEFRELQTFLAAINEMMTDRTIRDWEATHAEQCRMQVYVWDQLTYDHICRVVGRHLPRLLQMDGVKHLAWLFPSEELLPDPEHASRASPITIVENVVRAAVAVPVPHHYSLMGVARKYHPARVANAEAMLRLHPMFEDKLSDQIPSERAIEIWDRKDDWAEILHTLVETVKRQHTALSFVVERLQADLPLDRAKVTAPSIRAGAAAIRERMSLDGHLWLTFARLNGAMEARAAEDIRAMPIHEREARGKSARLLGRLTGETERQAYEVLGLRARPGRRAYALALTSTDVSIREGEMGFAIVPADRPGFLDASFYSVADTFGIEVNQRSGQPRWKMAEALAVTPVRVDRERLLVVVDETRQRPGILDELERTGAADLSGPAMLDPVHSDFFTKPLREVLMKVGRPAEAENRGLVMRATGQDAVVPKRPSKSTPLSRFLWTANLQAAARVEPLPLDLLGALEAKGIGLNPSQLAALRRSLEGRIHLIWGPPGTGKSHTLAATVAAALLEARLLGKGLRVLVTAFTWSAIDNLMPGIHRNAERLVPGCTRFARLASKASNPALPDGYPDIVVELDRHAPSAAIRELRLALKAGGDGDFVVVGSTPNQVVNLIRAGHPKGDAYMEELFDLVVIDEGSQLDVAHAALSLTSLATGGRVICAGDPLQMAPIHKAEPPKGLESMVGSVYLFLKEVHLISETQLTRNYRSNSEVVDAFRQAGYGDKLEANAPALRLRLTDPGDGQPKGWPSSLAWSPHLDEMLDPERPVACLVHRDSISAQSSEFEARLTVALVWRLWKRLVPGLSGEVDYEGRPVPPVAAAPAVALDFWGKRIGIVTPHRAQQGVVVNGLIKLFAPLGHDSEQIRKAVDTVERFQGQERDVMLASYAVGDPDTVADEAEFLHSLNRFNVMVSRARAKLLVVVTQEIVGHISDDIDIVRQSRLLKHIVEAHCRNRVSVMVPWVKADGTTATKDASLRWA